MLEDCCFTVRGLAPCEEYIRCLFDNKWVLFTEGEASEGVRGCRADMPRTKKEFELANWGLVFFWQSSVQVDIVQVLATGAKELKSISRRELVRVGHQVECLTGGEVREQEGVERLLRQVSV